MEPALIRVDEAAKYLSIGRSTLYELIARGDDHVDALDPDALDALAGALARLLLSAYRNTTAATGGAPARQAA